MHLPLVLALAASFSIVSSQTSVASYAPVVVTCPGNNFTSILRSTGVNQTINSDETVYIQQRRSKAAASYQAYLGNLSSIVYGGDASKLAPKIAISLSGGGDRAALYGASVLAALDSRNATAKSRGTGGLLQSASYTAGLSGGSWLLTSFVMNDMPQIYDMVLGWNLEKDLFTPTLDPTLQAGFVSSVVADVRDKFNAGFAVTMSDYWVRILSHHFLPGTTSNNFFENTTTNHGAELQFSDAMNLSSFTSFAAPYPIVTIAVYSVNTTDKPIVGNLIPLSNVVYEASPFEFGSFDTELATFLPMELLGSSGKNVTTPLERCVNNFAGAGFVLGASSALFNVYNVTNSITWTNALSPIAAMKNVINDTFGALQTNQQIDVTAAPNPFFGINNATYEDAAQTQLRLVDAGLDGQNTPLAPLLVKSRGIEVIIVADASNDIAGRPTGAALYAVAERTKNFVFAPFPPLPTNQSDFVKMGLNRRPTFLGCNGNVTSYPLIIYLPNFDTTGVTNTSTSQLAYSNTQSLSFLDTAFALTTRASDPNWPTCLACATVERQRQANGVARTPACGNCFQQYCYNELSTSFNGTSATGSGSGSVGAVPATTRSAGNKMETGTWLGGMILLGGSEYSFVLAVLFLVGSAWLCRSDDND